MNFTQCPYWGHGGQYIADPVTGVRTRVETPSETAVAIAATATDNTPDAGTDLPAKIMTTKKERRG